MIYGVSNSIYPPMNSSVNPKGVLRAARRVQASRADRAGNDVREAVGAAKSSVKTGWAATVNTRREL